MKLDEKTLTAIREYINAHRDGIVRDLKRLARIPSIRSEALPDAPFGGACRDALVEAVKLFRENGFDAETCSGNRYGLVKYGKAGGPTVCFFAHTDVVPVGDGWEYTSPFDPKEIDGFLVGRGCEDNKAGVVISLYVLKAFRELALPLDGQLQVFLGAAEETGMEDIEAFVSEQPMPDLSIVPDNAYPVCLGEKGILRTMVVSDGKLTDLLSFEGGQAYNVVLDRVTLGIRPGSALFDAVSEAAEGNPALTFTGDGKLTATGLTAHASVPESSVNAAKVAIDFLLSTGALNQNDEAILRSASYLLSGVHGEPFGIEREDPHFGPVTCANGIAGMRDGKLGLSFDIRYGSTSDGKTVEDSIYATLKKVGFTAESLDNDEGFLLPDGMPAAQSMIETYRFVTGREDDQPFYSGGGTYCRHLKNAFSIGTFLPGYPWLPTKPGHGGAHQPDELINVEALLGAATTATCMALGCLDSLI